MLESLVQSYGTLLRLRFISGLAPGVLQTAVPVYSHLPRPIREAHH